MRYMASMLRSLKATILPLMIAYLIGFGLGGQARPAEALLWNNQQFPGSGMLWMSGWKNYSGNLFVTHNWIGCVAN